jgi:hypothetical protein
MWLKEGGAEIALKQIRFNRTSAASSSPPPPPPLSSWAVFDDAEIFAAACSCLQQVRRNTPLPLHPPLHPFFLVPSHQTVNTNITNATTITTTTTTTTIITITIITIITFTSWALDSRSGIPSTNLPKIC